MRINIPKRLTQEKTSQKAWDSFKFKSAKNCQHT